MAQDPHRPALPDWVIAEAHMTVAAMLDDDRLVCQLDSLMPRDDHEFKQELIGRELELMANGVAPAEIAFRIAVFRAVREALAHKAAIRAIPTAAGQRVET